MKTSPNNPASSAWMGIAAYVAIYDAWAIRTDRETLSSAFLRSVKHPRKRIVVVGAWGFLSLHLFGKLPRTFDPLHIAAGYIESKKVAT